ncbi:MAG: hypothetical protein WEC99_03595 [Halofilum sp. (in: g-proteobacteria)]
MAPLTAGAASTTEPEGGGECPKPQSANENEAWPGQAQWQRLEAAGYRLGEFSIQVEDVYTGTSLAWYQRLANTLHLDTEPEVIDELLTVSPGEVVTAERIYEAERALREQSFLIDARIVPVACDTGRVTSAVRVRDAWTLQAGAGVGSAGGDATSSAGITDKNFLGTGKSVSLDWSEGTERSSVEVGYADPALFGSAWTLELDHADHSDGEREAVALAYPFRRADQDWGFRSSYETDRSELDFEEFGETAYSADAQHSQAHVEVVRRIADGQHGGWRGGLGWRREQAEYGELEEEAPDLRPEPALADRDLSGPYLVFERFSHRHKSFRNLQAIGKTEDYDLGFDARLMGGRYPRGDRWFYQLEARHGWALGERDLLVTRLDLAGRYHDDRGKEATYREVSADHYHRITPRNTWVTHGEYSWHDDPDPEDELYLGGYDGLLAYPNRFRSGDRRWLVHLENRYVSDVVLFDTVQLGYTVFFEAGNVRGFDGRWGRSLRDVGAGLRLGSLRSSFGAVSYVAVATPLVDGGQSDDYTVVLGSTVSF